MNLELDNHIRVHLRNPHLNYIILENCKYCKLDRRIQYGDNFQFPQNYNRSICLPIYYTHQSSIFTRNRIPNLSSRNIVYNNNQVTNNHQVTNNNLNSNIYLNNRISNSIIPPRRQIQRYRTYSLPEYRNIYTPIPEPTSNNHNTSVRDLNHNSNISLYLRGNNPPQKCSICYDNIRSFSIIRTLNCQHFFHQNCIDRWMEEKSSCPVCRFAI